MFTKLYVTVDEVTIWHMYDTKVVKDFRKDWVLITFVVFGTLMYLPFGIALLFIHIATNDISWFYLLVLLVIGVFWHLFALDYSRCNCYLSKYLKRKDKSKKLLELLSSDYLPMRLFLYNSKYAFVKGEIEDGDLVLEFMDGVVPHTVRGCQYESVHTTDNSKHGTIVLDLEGVTVYTE